ncbi:hypothetical protein B0H17DRAFT_297661 [Mycena rosella]|uniref:Uncharacterized protein n=1 Tax=Mycena rosella TaxID=1033263 RepID=A0AAD7DTW3_MYCRO|nr:hypothetical protein B0H17DRAFT_297661 [Mycena rosella]
MVLVLQYFRKFPRDPISIRIVVCARHPPCRRKYHNSTRSSCWFLGLFTTNHTIFMVILNYKTFVTMYGNLADENIIP